MKKTKKILIGCLGGCLLFIYGYYFSQNYQRLQQNRFEEAESHLIEQVYQDLDFKPENVRLVTKTYDKTELILVIPENEKGKVITDLNATINQLAEEIAKKETQKDSVKIAISAVPEKTKHNLTRYHYNQSIYRWDKWQNNWDKTVTPLTAETLINEQSSRSVTLGDVFQSQKNLTTINQEIQRDLLAAASHPEKAIDDILALPLLLADQTNFKLSDNQIKLLYTGKDAYLSEYILDFKKVGQYLNPEFVDEKYLTPVEELPARTDEKVVALTFDDGPNNTTTEKVLATLKKEKVPATFFMLGQQVDSFPEMAKKIADAGHELANHSYSHPDLATLKTADIRQEINKTQSAIYRATGILPTYVRPPYGSFTYETAVAINQPLVNWNVDTLDWQKDDTKTMVKRIQSQVNNDSIILMHDIQQSTVDALPKVIEMLKKEDYKFMTVSDLLQQSTEGMTIHYSGSNQADVAKTAN